MIFKLSTLVILFFISLSTLGSDWSITKKDGFFLLHENSDTDNTYQLQSDGGTRKIDRIEEYNEGTTRIIYISGVAGTSELIIMRRAVVFKNKSKTFLGDFPYSYSGEDGKRTGLQPRWSYNKGLLTVTEFAEDEQWKIKLK